jgi:hypothetical protein
MFGRPDFGQVVTDPIAIVDAMPQLPTASNAWFHFSASRVTSWLPACEATPVRGTLHPDDNLTMVKTKSTFIKAHSHNESYAW